MHGIGEITIALLQGILQLIVIFIYSHAVTTSEHLSPDNKSDKEQKRPGPREIAEPQWQSLKFS